MGLQDGLDKSAKLSRSSLHQSEDFRAGKKKGGLSSILDFLNPFSSDDTPLRPEPTLSPITDSLALPFLGPVRMYLLLLLVLFLIYAVFPNMLIGLLAGLVILFAIAWEFYCGVKTGGWKGELREILFAILIALGIWYGAGFLLSTPTPINAIVSCSMLPSFARGDMVILQGGPVNTQYFNYSGPASDINSSGLVSVERQTFAINGSMMSHCQQASGATDANCERFSREPEAFLEEHGPLGLRYGACERDFASGQKVQTICVKEIYVEGRTVPFNPSNELVVYSTSPSEFWAGADIVHRVRLALDTTSGPIYLTKGDNNPIFDFQAYDESSGRSNKPVSPAQVKGRVVLRIPQIGNLKLFITPSVLADLRTQAMCDSHFAQPA